MPTPDTYFLYLRKSRKDVEAESLGQPDTLKRHRTALLALAQSMHLNVSHIFEEVVSGDSIAARPEMQKLLAAIEQGTCAGVLVMEVERLARGDTVDQGIVAQTFKYSGTKIITPAKVYDPNNEFDEEYFEFGLFMSRREYKTINRRLQRGRDASMREGKFVGNKTPYGYDRKKLEHDKGFRLVPIPEQARIVCNMYNWYTGADGAARIGVSLIARRLNELCLLSPTGKDWTTTVIRGILSNPVYAGWIRWGNRAESKHVVDGEVVCSRPRAKKEDVKLYPGLHEPIITQQQFDLAQQHLSLNPSRPGPAQVEMTNPLSGLIICEQCGRRMVRRPYPEREATILCTYTSCPTVSSDISEVEDAIMDGLRRWLRELTFQYRDIGRSTEDSSLLLSSADSLEKELQQLTERESRAYELVESGVYTPDVFLSRMQAIQEDRTTLTVRLSEQRKKIEDMQVYEFARKQLAPDIQHVLESYPLSKSPSEKNALLKSILSKCTYHKSIRHNKSRTNETDFSLTLYPTLPTASPFTVH